VVTLGSKTWDWGLLLSGLPLCLATRAANIFPLSRLANLRRKLPLSLNLQVCGILPPVVSGSFPGMLLPRC
jgi:CPA1 family monovalent cation:H+ antiporter/sodium/hydrogen exchanger 8